MAGAAAFEKPKSNGAHPPPGYDEPLPDWDLDDPRWREGGGTMATTYGVLNWPHNEAFHAAAAGFRAWLTARGGTGAAEDRQAVLTIRRFIEAHEVSRFQLVFTNGANPDPAKDEIRDNRLSSPSPERSITRRWEKAPHSA